MSTNTGAGASDINGNNGALSVDSGSDGTCTAEEWPGPGVVRTNTKYGKYVVASRRIEAEELICEEEALLESPYGPTDRIPFCLNCYKDLSPTEKCLKCRWPLCQNESCAVRLVLGYHVNSKI
jgi:hypothetical protein